MPSDARLSSSINEFDAYPDQGETPELRVIDEDLDFFHHSNYINGTQRDPEL